MEKKSVCIRNVYQCSCVMRENSFFFHFILHVSYTYLLEKEGIEVREKE